MTPEDVRARLTHALRLDLIMSFVTSANFTEWAQQRNVEAGVLIRNAQFARQLRQQFEGLVQSRAVIEVPGFRA
jgi:phosphatidylserine/phosphatidylglycerophosphate/cardiolipin synthase-like enzyme